MPYQKMFVMDFYGDLPVKAPPLCAVSRVFGSIDEALVWLDEHVAKDWTNDDSPFIEDRNSQDSFWFDPEDDRIVIWEIMPDNKVAKVVWHASGWHWQHDASDLVGGPLEQGKLPCDTLSLYERAISE